MTVDVCVMTTMLGDEGGDTPMELMRASVVVEEATGGEGAIGIEDGACWTCCCGGSGMLTVIVTALVSYTVVTATGVGDDDLDGSSAAWTVTGATAACRGGGSDGDWTARADGTSDR